MAKKKKQLGGYVYPVNYVPQAEDGWLSKYEDGGEYLGTTNKGFDYNGAWGGQWQDGGKLTAEQLESLNLAKMKSKMALAAAFGNPSAKRMTSASPSTYKFSGNETIDGKPIGVPAGETGTHFMASMGEYAVPYIQEGSNGKLQFKPNASFRDREAIRFDNPKDAEYFAEHYKEVAPMMRHYAMGGSLPGASGMMYARVGAPSNGKYAKKTKASAQNGMEMSFYQNGLDWTPRNISRDGSEIPKAQSGIISRIIGDAAEAGLSKETKQAAAEYAASKASRMNHMKELVKMKQEGVDLAKFFENLQWTNQGRDLWKEANKYNTKILTGGRELAPGQDAISTGKRLWSKKNLNLEGDNIIVEKQKHKYANPNVILVDDLKDNVENFKKAGGHAILHTDVKKTVKQLNKHMAKNPNHTVYMDLDGVLVDLQGGVHTFRNGQKKKGGVIKDDRGQWAHPGEITEIQGNTMATHGYGDIPLWVEPDVGQPRLVQPNTGIHTFPGAKKFKETPVSKNWLDKYK